jgi:hypothetical protein
MSSCLTRIRAARRVRDMSKLYDEDGIDGPFEKMMADPICPRCMGSRAAMEENLTMTGKNHPNCADDEICGVCADETAHRVFGKTCAGLIPKWEAMYSAWESGLATSPSAGDLAESMCDYFGIEYDAANSLAADIDYAQCCGNDLIDCARYALSRYYNSRTVEA